MPKKGKYHLLSYIVDRYLIFYKSFNRNKKIIAFAILEAKSIGQIISMLNEFLKKRFLHYYSIQLNPINEEKTLFILNFKELIKENIVRVFNIIYQQVIEKDLQIEFQEGSMLEEKFLELFLPKIDSNTILMENAQSLLIINNSNSLQLDFFSISLDKVNNQDAFLPNFNNIIKNFNRKGYVIANFFCDKEEEIQITLYFAELIVNTENSFNTENKINNFFKTNIIKRHPLKIKEFYNFLWRKGINNKFFLWKSYSHLLLENYTIDSPDLKTFNQDFEKKLLKNDISFIRFNKNLLFIEESFLFLTMIKLDSIFIQRIIQKYLAKYSIYILLLNKQDAQKLLEIKSFASLRNVRVLNLEELAKLDFERFKKSLDQ